MHPPTHSLTLSFTHSLTYSLAPTHSFILSLTYSLTLTHSLTYSPTLTHSRTHALTHSLTNSLTHSHSLTPLTHSLRVRVEQLQQRKLSAGGVLQLIHQNMRPDWPPPIPVWMDVACARLGKCDDCYWIYAVIAMCVCIYNIFDKLRYAFKILNQEALYRESNHLGTRVPSTSPKLERDKFKIGSGD